MKGAWSRKKSVALAFLQASGAPGSDRAFVMAFGDGSADLPGPTSEVSDLIGAVKQAKGPASQPISSTPYIPAASNQWKAHRDRAVHRVIIVISDGEDTGSRHGLSDVIAAAQRNEIQIYTLNVHLKKRSYPGEGSSAELADETGGRFFVANSAPEADAIFSELEQELRTQYYVSFRPQAKCPATTRCRWSAGPEEADGSCTAWILR